MQTRSSKLANSKIDSAIPDTMAALRQSPALSTNLELNTAQTMNTHETDSHLQQTMRIDTESHQPKPETILLKIRAPSSSWFVDNNHILRKRKADNEGISNGSSGPENPRRKIRLTTRVTRKTSNFHEQEPNNFNETSGTQQSGTTDETEDEDEGTKLAVIVFVADFIPCQLKTNILEELKKYKYQEAVWNHQLSTSEREHVERTFGAALASLTYVKLWFRVVNHRRLKKLLATKRLGVFWHGIRVGMHAEFDTSSLERVEESLRELREAAVHDKGDIKKEVDDDNTDSGVEGDNGSKQTIVHKKIGSKYTGPADGFVRRRRVQKFLAARKFIRKPSPLKEELN